MNAVTITIGVCLDEEQALELEPFALACGAEAAYVRLLVDEGLVQPLPDRPDWHFHGEQIARVRRIRRLQHDFETSLQAVAVMVELLDEVDRLRARLRRAGLGD